MLRFRRVQHITSDSLNDSSLYNQETFYRAFLEDLGHAKSQVIIESPFITSRRMAALFTTLRKLSKRGVQVVINTRNPEEHDGVYQFQAESAIANLQNLGITVLYTAGHHRKLAIIDGRITYEGSLNILSQSDTCEIMRRIYSEQLANQMLSFLNLQRFIG